MLSKYFSLLHSETRIRTSLDRIIDNKTNKQNKYNQEDRKKMAQRNSLYRKTSKILSKHSQICQGT